MKLLKIVGIVVAVVVLLLLGARGYFAWVANPRVVEELRADPQGERARKVMLLALPSGRELPVNYYREPGFVYAAADGLWWRELEGSGHPVTVWVQGERLAGRARAVRDDPEYTKRVFAKLRPDALPGFGTLIEIALDESGPEDAKP